MTRPVRLTIEHLVLDGVATKDRAALMRAFRNALTAKVQASALGESRTIGQQSVTLAAGTNGVAPLGRAAGRAVARTVKGSKT